MRRLNIDTNIPRDFCRRRVLMASAEASGPRAVWHVGGNLARGPVGVQAPPGYHFLNLIDSGSFGTVFEAQRLSDGMICAVKQIKVSGVPEALARKLMAEDELLSRLRHRGIVQCLGCYYDDQRLIHNVIMEFCPGGNLESRVSLLPGRRLPPSEFPPLALGLLQALHYLHSVHVIHRDIKVWVISCLVAQRPHAFPCHFHRVVCSLPTSSSVWTGFLASPISGSQNRFWRRWAAATLLLELRVFKLPRCLPPN